MAEQDSSVTVERGPADKRGPKPWCAQITGLDKQYGLARTFCDPLEKGYAFGEKGYVWTLTLGLYEIGASEKDGLYMAHVRADGKFGIVKIDSERALAIAGLLDRGMDFEAARRATKPEVRS